MDERFLDKIESGLKNLSSGKVLDIGNLEFSSAHFLRIAYGKRYDFSGPSEDNFNPGKYAIAFYFREDNQNA